MNKTILSAAAALTAAIIIAFYFMSVPEEETPPEVRASRAGLKVGVMNGCGVKGVGARFVEYLRDEGFDVVEMKNYLSFDVTTTLIVDRNNKPEAAKDVARALGANANQVITDIDPKHLVDISVIIGHDYARLNSTSAALTDKARAGGTMEARP